jgi:hypothetical protein
MADEAPDPDDELGPIDCLAVEFPGGRITGDGFGVLLDPIDRGFLRILDLEFVAEAPDGGVDVGSVDTEPGLDLSPFQCASSGILDPSDLDDIGGIIGPSSVAAVLVYEELVILPLIAAWQRSGARVIAEGQISPEDIVLARRHRIRLSTPRASAPHRKGSNDGNTQNRGEGCRCELRARPCPGDGNKTDGRHRIRRPPRPHRSPTLHLPRPHPPARRR